MEKVENNIQDNRQADKQPVDGLVMLPYYDQDGITIYNADCRTAMRALRPSWIVTDPPYGINYNAERQNLPGATKRNDIANDDGSFDLEFIFRAEGNNPTWA